MSKKLTNNNQQISQPAPAKQSTEQLVLLMSQINAAVKASEFSTQLANKIFSLCQHLKSNGQLLEQTNKSDLNKVFVSLRQACCRDNGQLGTPCRLKIMELIELRAMHWKTNLAHTQYYLNKTERVNGQHESQAGSSTATTTPPSNKNHLPSTTSTHSSRLQNTQPTFSHPVQQQQMTYQPVQMAPQQSFNNFAQPPPSLYLPPEIAANQGAPGYFLIPAAGAWTTSQMIPTNLVPGAQFAPQMRQPHPNPHDWISRNAAVAAVSAHFGKLPSPNMMSQSAYLPGSNSKSSKLPQLREEVTIRNADSGKIMGVKGRRVAAVEEISKTVISFQKVDNNSRYRTLAITGSTADAIQHAKKLIEETIKRNVSPNRLDLNGAEQVQQQTMLTGTQIIGADQEEALEDEELDDEDTPNISIETNKDGTLKVSCTDPEMLQAAQQALTEYLSLRTNRMSAEERAERKERRKSMPLQSSSNSANATNTTQQTKVPVVDTTQTKPNGSLSDTRKALTGSTPNLLVESTTIDGVPKNVSDEDVLRYERDKMLSLREQVQTQLTVWREASTGDDSKNDQMPYKQTKSGAEADPPKTNS
ncbi:KH domain-containing protein [Aphelenchoides bicaudatus]|nr:KH domain-containing protein [Aphelenchoides bicaudatus]